ncbi:MAG TPA: MerR family transcriptional regulator [Nitriliruptorales bacterium]|nr:MerR family transcriptional regulator [Nitriliruptorales bacterium]
MSATDQASYQIGEVADRVGLSLRTVRYYEEVGLVEPSGRTPGGFRLYTDDDVARLHLIKRMKPLGFTLEETRDLLAVRDALHSGELDAAAVTEAAARLSMYAAAATARCEELGARLAAAEKFAAALRRETVRHAGREHP